VSLDAASRYEIAAGTVTGRSHTLSGRPNQDAHAWLCHDDVLVAVVCDGCGSSAHSEVGARLGARLCAARLSARLVEGAALDAPALWEGLRDDVLGALRDLANAMGGRLAETVADHFLFTVVGLAFTGEQGCVFAAGDGIAAVDGDITRLGPFPGNEPPYLAYGLLSRGAPGFSVIRAFTGARSALVGTDGAADLADLAARPLPGGGAEVGPLAQLWEEDRYFRNPDALRRRLALVNREVTRPRWEERRIDREAGLLGDDTTVVVVRRKQG
jgi:Protein phosphatase 2C